MVHVCAFTVCGKKMKSYNLKTFHRLPLQEPTLKQWLVVLQLDVETPVHTKTTGITMYVEDGMV